MSQRITPKFLVQILEVPRQMFYKLWETPMLAQTNVPGKIAHHKWQRKKNTPQ